MVCLDVVCKRTGFLASDHGTEALAFCAQDMRARLCDGATRRKYVDGAAWTSVDTPPKLDSEELDRGNIGGTIEIPYPRRSR